MKKLITLEIIGEWRFAWATEERRKLVLWFSRETSLKNIVDLMLIVIKLGWPPIKHLRCFYELAGEARELRRRSKEDRDATVEVHD